MESIDSKCEIHVKTITGKKIKILPQDIHTRNKTNISCIDIKNYIERIEMIPSEIQKIVYRSTTLADNDIIDIIDNITILYLIVNIRGGMFHETSGRLGMITYN